MTMTGSAAKTEPMPETPAMTMATPMVISTSWKPRTKRGASVSSTGAMGRSSAGPAMSSAPAATGSRRKTPRASI